MRKTVTRKEGFPNTRSSLTRCGRWLGRNHEGAYSDRGIFDRPVVKSCLSDCGGLPQDGFSQQTFYLWKKYAGLVLSELRQLRQLREENAKLKWLVADLSLDRHILQEIVETL